MIPFCSRFDSVLFTPKTSAIASYGNYSRSPRSEQRQGATEIADAEGAIEEVGQSCSGERRCGDGCPIQEGVEPLRSDLRTQDHKQCGAKNCRANEITEPQLQRHFIATYFPQCGRKYLNDPEAQRDFWHLASFHSDDLIHKSVSP